MWQIVSSGEVSELEAWLKRAPGLIHLRAEDGRGPLWWAYEYDRPDMVALLVREGADLHLKHAISLADAICGLSHLDVRSLDAAPRVM